MSEISRLGLMSELLKESKSKRDQFSFNKPVDLTPQKKILIRKTSPIDEEVGPPTKEVKLHDLSTQKGRPVLSQEEKRKKCVVYFTRVEERQIKLLYNDRCFNKLSPSIRKAMLDLFKLKDRERKQGCCYLL
jgi:hypothetical protein